MKDTCKVNGCHYSKSFCCYRPNLHFAEKTISDQIFPLYQFCFGFWVFLNMETKFKFNWMMWFPGNNLPLHDPGWLFQWRLNFHQHASKSSLVVSMVTSSCLSFSPGVCKLWMQKKCNHFAMVQQTFYHTSSCCQEVEKSFTCSLQQFLCLLQKITRSICLRDFAPLVIVGRIIALLP